MPWSSDEQLLTMSDRGNSITGRYRRPPIHPMYMKIITFQFNFRIQRVFIPQSLHLVTFYFAKAFRSYLAKNRNFVPRSSRFPSSARYGSDMSFFTGLGTLLRRPRQPLEARRNALLVFVSDREQLIIVSNCGVLHLYRYTSSCTS